MNPKIIPQLTPLIASIKSAIQQAGYNFKPGSMNHEQIWYIYQLETTLLLSLIINAEGNWYVNDVYNNHPEIRQWAEDTILSLSQTAPCPNLN